MTQNQLQSFFATGHLPLLLKPLASASLLLLSLARYPGLMPTRCLEDRYGCSARSRTRFKQRSCRQVLWSSYLHAGLQSSSRHRLQPTRYPSSVCNYGSSSTELRGQTSRFSQTGGQLRDACMRRRLMHVFSDAGDRALQNKRPHIRITFVANASGFL